MVMLRTIVDRELGYIIWFIISLILSSLYLFVCGNDRVTCYTRACVVAS